MTVACAIIPFISINNASNIDTLRIFQIETILLYICIGLFLICKILADLQGVYLFFGLIRNPFYPINCLSGSFLAKNHKSVNEKRFFFQIIKYLRLIIIKIISPLILCTVVTLDCSINKTYQNKNQTYWRIICILRAFRWVIKSKLLRLHLNFFN